MLQRQDEINLCAVGKRRAALPGPAFNLIVHCESSF